MPLNENKAKHMFENAKAWVEKELGFPPHVQPDFDTLGPERFLAEYCHVVFSAWFRVQIVWKHADEMAKAFKHYNLEALAEMDSIDLSTVPIKNKRKVESFLAGAKAIHAEGFDAFKARVNSRKDDKGRMDELKSLKGIGDVTKKHLAMITGVANTFKDDVWLRSCAGECGVSGDHVGVESLVEFLATEFQLDEFCVDTTLWEYCQRNQRTPPTTKSG